MQEIPRTWIITIFMVAMVIMRFFSIDSWTTAMLSAIAAYLLGQHIEATTDTKYIDTSKENPLDNIQLPPGVG